MDLRTQTSLLASVLAMGIAVSVLVRERRRRLHWSFAFFGATVALWYSTTFLGRLEGGPVWERVNLVWAVLVPVAAMRFFRALLAADDTRVRQLDAVALAAGAALVAVALTPLYVETAFKAAIFTFVVAVLLASLALLWRRGRRSTSRFEGARLRYLALVGAAATTFTLADYLPYVGVDIPPVGTVLTLVFLYALAQAVARDRLLDLYEIAGRLGVLTILAFTLAAVFWLLVALTGGRFFLHSVVAALVVLLVFDPVRGWVEQRIAQLFFRERHGLEQALGETRRQLGRSLEVPDVVAAVLAGLERSRRVTHAAVYLVDDDGLAYRLAGHVGPEPPPRIERTAFRPLLDRLERDQVLVLETLEREAAERLDAGDRREARAATDVAAMLDALGASVAAPIRGDEGTTYGLLVVRDERLRDAFSPEEVDLLRALGAQAALAIENSRVYQRFKERDRLAALGEMAAGLAHEIRNPLGAIKGSAQVLAETEAGEEAREFLGIIVEEVDRLDRVVRSFLDYARPARGNPQPTDVGTVVQRTVSLLAAECERAGIEVRIDLAEQLPPVRVDADRLHQVLINLVQNAVQAMEGRGGELRLSTSAHPPSTPGESGRVEVRVADTGPGIPREVLGRLFVPFVTTKERGTGLGLAVSQRIVAAAGGRIEVRSSPGNGATFIVHLPVADDRDATSTAGASPSNARAARFGAGGEGGAQDPSGRCTRPVDGHDSATAPRHDATAEAGSRPAHATVTDGMAVVARPDGAR
ncbi:MAG: ATP-binding protein [Myxococcota bacterium]|nr:ATP-binding protein [Myxococcota bacterium]